MVCDIYRVYVLVTFSGGKKTAGTFSFDSTAPGLFCATQTQNKRVHVNGPIL